MNNKKPKDRFQEFDVANLWIKASMYRFWPALVILIGVTMFFSLGLDQYFTFDVLSKHRKSLLQWTGENRILALSLFVIGYVIVVACSLPSATWMSVTGGFMFGTVFGTFAVVISATLGSVAVFLIARHISGNFFQTKMGKLGRQIETGFRKDAFSYLLFLRLVPFFPFWIVNIAPALLGVPLRVYMFSTIIGIIPGSAVYCSVGSGLSVIFETGVRPDLDIIFQPYILAPLVGLGVLALIPIMYRRINFTRE